MALRGLVSAEGWVLQGDAAVQAMRDEWAQYWGDAKDSLTDIQRSVARTGALERPSLDRARSACRSLPRQAGLGVDCVNPRFFDLLGDDSIHRPIDFLMRWEADPDLPGKWPIMVSLGKPDGSGVQADRPHMLHLAGSGQSQAGHAHDSPVFWGQRDRERDGAGRANQAFVHHARSVGMQCASGSCDLV